MPTIPLNIPDTDSADGLSLQTLERLAAQRNQTVEQYINTTVAFANGHLPIYEDMEHYTTALRKAGIPEEIGATQLQVFLRDVP